MDTWRHAVAFVVTLVFVVFFVGGIQVGDFFGSLGRSLVLLGGIAGVWWWAGGD